MKDEIKKLIDLMNNGAVKAYRVNQATGIDQAILSKLKSGKKEVGTLTLNNATKLYNYQKELEMENMMEQIRKELESVEEGYYVEQYEDFYDLLEEREITEDEYYELVSDVDHEVILGTPVVVYENPSSSLFNVVYFDGGDDADDVILQLQGLA